jgi:hypothetical protein
VVRQITPDLHFSKIATERNTASLYGLAVGGPHWESPVRLVRIDPGDGRILQSRLLDSTFWRIAAAPLRPVTLGDVRLNLPDAVR